MSNPAPYPADTRAKGWRFELDHERIRQSDTWAIASPDLRPWLLMLWMTAWEQTPCGSLPTDDELIAARIGMSPKLFAKHRALLLRGWWQADDGRLYHDTLAARALEMIRQRGKNAKRVADWKASHREQQSGNALAAGEQPARNDTGTGTISSVPIGTDAAAASALPKGRNPEEQAKADLWRTAVEVLLAGGCNTEATCRTFMGKLVTDYGFDVVQKAVAAAVTAQPADAREYLKATCQRLKGERKDPVTVPSKAAEETAQALAAERARQVTKPPPEVAALIASAVKRAA